MKEPILLVDSHHGVYSPFLAYQFLNDEIKEKVNKQLSKEEIEILSQNIDLIYGKDIDWELVYEAFESLCSIEIAFEGTNWQIEQNEDVWLVPEGYYFEEY